MKKKKNKKKNPTLNPNLVICTHFSFFIPHDDYSGLTHHLCFPLYFSLQKVDGIFHSSQLETWESLGRVQDLGRLLNEGPHPALGWDKSSGLREESHCCSEVLQEVEAEKEMRLPEAYWEGRPTREKGRKQTGGGGGAEQLEGHQTGPSWLAPQGAETQRLPARGVMHCGEMARPLHHCHLQFGARDPPPPTSNIHTQKRV